MSNDLSSQPALWSVWQSATIPTIRTTQTDLAWLSAEPTGFEKLAISRLIWP